MHYDCERAHTVLVTVTLNACLGLHVRIKHTSRPVVVFVFWADSVLTHTHIHPCPVLGCEQLCLEGRVMNLKQHHLFGLPPRLSSVTLKNAHAGRVTLKCHLTDTCTWWAAITWLLWNAGTLTREFPAWLHTLFKASRCCTTMGCVRALLQHLCQHAQALSFLAAGPCDVPPLLAWILQGIWDCLSWPDLPRLFLKHQQLATAK